jgi:hypothetical protein
VAGTHGETLLQPSPADEAAGEGEEAFVDLVAAIGTNEQAAAVVQPGEGALDDPAVATEPGAVLSLAASDDRLHAALPDEPAVLVVVVAAVGDQRPRSASRPPYPAADRRHTVEQLEQLGGVVAVATGERPGERDTAAVYKQVVLAAATASVGRAGTCLLAPFFACRWLESATARSHSSRSAACSSASSSSWSFSQTPACCQSRSLRQAVIPQPKPSSCGRCRQPIPVCNTNKMPCNTRRSSSGLRPG